MWPKESLAVESPAHHIYSGGDERADTRSGVEDMDNWLIYAILPCLF